MTHRSTVQNNPYLAPLRLLSPLCQTKCTIENLTSYFIFSSRFPDEFEALLRGKDPRALLLLAFWYGLIGVHDGWWTVKRAKIECTAICMLLEKDPDPRIRRLLSFPAHACGYELRGKEPSEEADFDQWVAQCAQM